MAYGFTYTLPTLSAVHSHYVVNLKTADFPAAALNGANAFANGGGNLVAYTDDTKTTQLPVEVSYLVTGATPSAKVDVRFVPTATTGQTIYIEADDTQTTQPAATSTYGRNNVWQDRNSALHLLETSGTTVTDSAGLRDGTFAGSLPAPGVDFGQDFDGTDDAVSYGNSAIGGFANGFTFKIRMNADSVSGGAHQLFSADDNGSGRRCWQWRVNNGKHGMIVWDEFNNIVINTEGTATISTGVDYIMHFSHDGTNYKIFTNGVEDQSAARTQGLPDLNGTHDPAHIGYRATTQHGSNYEPFDGQLGDFELLSGGYLTPDYIADQADNELSPTAWGTVGAWEEQGSSGAEVTPTTAATSTLAYSPSVAAGASVSPDAATSSTVAYSPSIAAGASVQPSVAITATTAFSPVISSGAAVYPDAASTATIAYSPTVSGIDAVEIFPTTAITATIAYSPAITTGASVTPDTATTSTVAYSPTVGVVVNVTPAAAETTTTAYNPVIATGVNVSPDFAATATTAYNPVVATGGFVFPDTAVTLSAAYDPEVIAGVTELIRQARITGCFETQQTLSGVYIRSVELN